MSTAPVRRLVAQPPLRYLSSAEPWWALAYVATGAGLGAVSLLVLGVLIGLGLLLSVIGVGVLMPVGAVLLSIPLAEIERRRLRMLEEPGAPAAEAMHAPVEQPGLRPWLAVRLREQVTWREFAYAVVFATVFLVVNLALLVPTVLLGAMLAVPPWVAYRTGQPEALILTAISLPAVPVALYGYGAVAALQARLARLLLYPPDDGGPERDAQVVELTRSRARLADAFETERHLIQRDLHDGAQQRLVALVMTLGLAELELDGAERGGGEEAVRQGAELVKRARGEAKEALTELRDLVHGIHPQVLTDRGLAAAVSEVAVRCPVPVRVELEVAERLPRQVEATAYFVVSEALTNVAKHSGASSAAVSGGWSAGKLTVTVHDDGVGGAALRVGSGLQGLADRAAVVGGRLVLSSPPGGPTALNLEVPCPPSSSASS
ncbi:MULTISPECIES: sensor histidine kinase [Streptomyces]|uniref:sensor histidine kinase n=1 Tax=Streptomyces TaxID=1883 RepID=UPI00056677B0|nr:MULTISPECIES: sensor histidine kinase [unclassified Streptomyces]